MMLAASFSSFAGSSRSRAVRGNGPQKRRISSAEPSRKWGSVNPGLDSKSHRYSNTGDVAGPTRPLRC
jgi:hypothetical protein